MPGMPSQNLDPTNAHLKAAGQRLQDARLAQDISVDAVMRELKVTRLQIAGIESGNPKSFYNETFFVDLLKRYARLLNFSETAIAKMVTPPVLEVIESSPAAPVPPESSVDEATGQATGQATTQVTNDVNTEADDAKDAHALDSTAASPKAGSRWMGLLALVGVVGAGIAVGLQVTDSSQPSTLASAPVAATAAPSTSPTPQAGTAPTATGAEPAAPAAKPVAESLTAAPAPNPAPAAPEPVPSAAKKPELTKAPETKPIAPSPQKVEAEPEQAATKTIVDTPMVLTAKRKSWIWVRDATDQVRQFGVAEGQTVKFDQLPIYIVVHDPTGFEVVIGNKVIPLVRNNEERNVARHTRTDLINFFK